MMLGVCSNYHTKAVNKSSPERREQATNDSSRYNQCQSQADLEPLLITPSK